MSEILEIEKIKFNHIRLHQISNELNNVFRWKNNKTLFETVNSKRYKKLYLVVNNKYKEHLDKPLGIFLYELKMKGDNFYKQFLNRYGDGTYSKFEIDKNLNDTGLYTFLHKSNIVYIGKTNDSLVKRINNGYGNISPKNCYLDGQATNCHINCLITTNWSDISLFFSGISDKNLINSLEEQLIKKIQPNWNIALKDK